MEPFWCSVETMRGRRGAKWHRYPDDVLPAWVADMDFTVAEPIQRAIMRVVEQQDYGYPWRQGEASLGGAFRHRMLDRYGWEIDPERVMATVTVVQPIFAAITALTQPGDGILIQTPIYHPFLHAIDELGRRRVMNPLVDDGTRFVLDIEGLRRVTDSGTKIMLLCNPHNPSGRVFTRAELEALAQVALERDLVIISDEIHSDLIYPGYQHIPIATLSPEVAARTITVTSASKGFNLPGLHTAVAYFGSPELQKRFTSVIHPRIIGAPATVGVDATVAAWHEGQPWLDAVLKRLAANRDRIAEFLAAEIPEIRYYKPEATYLAWLDCRDLNLPGESPQQFFLNEGKVAFNAGGDFGPPGVTCVRLNFGTCPDTLEQILGRMAKAVRAGRPALAPTD